MEESGRPAPGTGRLVAASTAIVLLVAGAVWLELRLFAFGLDAEQPWRTVLVLSAILFVPAIVVGAALALFLRRRRR